MNTSENTIDLHGLTQEEVDSRVKHGLVNKKAESGTKTKEEIIKENVFTPFNAIFLVLAFLLLIAGKFSDMTFLGVVIANTAIGTFQQLKSKEAVDKLTILSSRKYTVHRAEGNVEILGDQLVRDDVVELVSGDQIPADGVLLTGNLRVNESLLTGEQDDIEKRSGDFLHSGSICTAGNCVFRLTAVGDESYASRLAKEATTDVKNAKSDMMQSLDKIILVIGILLVPIGILLFWNEFVTLDQSFSDSIQSMVAGLIGMIPEGLYLLTSVALAASVLRLARKRVLVRDLNCVETLARIDTLCVDKTGTITEEGMDVAETRILRDSVSNEEYERIMTSFANAFPVKNATANALCEYFKAENFEKPKRIIPFNSTLKYSAAEFEKLGSIIVGAPQFIYGNHLLQFQDVIDQYASQGLRVLLVAKLQGPLTGKPVNEDLVEPIGILALSNHVRKNAKETFAYFREQGVNVKVISGDDPVTVSAIATQVEIPGSENYVDSSTLETDEQIKDAVIRYTVFGRTTPEQKKKMVLALQSLGHSVAMTGDGVNDVLALKEADCGIAMASGSDAASQIAQLVLLDSDFSAVPNIVAEGRRVINNIERSARLFLSKNIFSILLSVFCVVLSISYPLRPLQLSFLSALTIGIPGFFLALQPNDGIIKGRFISNVLYNALPGGICDLILIGSLNIYALVFGFTDSEINTMSFIIALIVGIIILYHACKPFNVMRVLIWIGVVLASVFCIVFLNDVMSIVQLQLQADLILVLFVLLAYPCMQVVQWTIRKLNTIYHRIAVHFQ